MLVVKSDRVMTEASKAWRKGTVTLAPAKGVLLALVVSGVVGRVGGHQRMFADPDLAEPRRRCMAGSRLCP